MALHRHITLSSSRRAATQGDVQRAATCTRRPSGGSVNLGDDESSTVSSTVPPPLSCISFFVTYRRSGGAQPTQRMRFWRVGQGWSWGTCLRVHGERRPAN